MRSMQAVNWTHLVFYFMCSTADYVFGQALQ
jgi:hypothetical protein